MRPPSLKWRVSILTAAVLSAAIAAGFALIYEDTRETLSEQVDANLLSTAKAAVAIMNDAETPAAQAAGLQVRVGVSPQRRSSFYRVWVSGSAEDLHAGGLGGSEAALRELVTNRPPPAQGRSIFLDAGSQEDPYRLIWTSALTPGGSVNILIGQSMNAIRSELNELLNRIMAIGGGVVAGSIILVTLLVAWGLRPIQATAVELLSVTAANVGAVRLDGRGAPSELRPFVDSANGMLDRLNDALEKQKAFVSDASHELRTPIALAKSTVQLALSRERAPADYEKTLAGVLDDLRRMEHLVEELLTLARVDEAVVADAGEVDLEALLSRLVEAYSPLAREQGGQIVASLQPVRIWGSESQLPRLFANVIDNAVKYGPRGGKIVISVEDGAPGRVVASVTDEGGSISKDALPHLFDRFYRVDSSRSRSTGGAGLGLAIAQAIALRHRGEISITSDAKTGTSVRVSLPRRAPPP